MTDAHDTNAAPLPTPGTGPAARPPLPNSKALRRKARRDGGYDMVPAYTAEEVSAYADACVAAGCAARGTGDMFQQRVHPWLMSCFGAQIASDKSERNHRFLEEALELVQACGCTEDEARQLVAYVYGRPVGEPSQEAGGVMMTLAALCLAQGLDMHASGYIELARVWTKVEQIRAKQAAKPRNSPLPAEQVSLSKQHQRGLMEKDMQPVYEAFSEQERSLGFMGLPQEERQAMYESYPGKRAEREPLTENAINEHRHKIIKALANIVNQPCIDGTAEKDVDIIRREPVMREVIVIRDAAYALAAAADRAVREAEEPVVQPQRERLNHRLQSAPAYEKPVGPFTGAGDPLYQDAVALVRKHKRASISLVQRHLRIGYIRAAYMLEAMVGTVLAKMPPTSELLPEAAHGVKEQP